MNLTYNKPERNTLALNILQVTTYDSMGQQFNGYQLHRALMELGHKSHMAVRHSRFNDTHIHQVGNRLTHEVDLENTPRIEGRLGIQSLLPLSALTLFCASYYKNADIVHLQLVYSEPFFSLLILPLMSRKHHVVWTQHDPWMTSGHCVYSLDCDRWLTGCRDCPDLPLYFPLKRDTSAFMWRMKNWIMHHSKVTLVVASQWMYERVQRSPILSHLPCHIIPLGIDTSVFKPRDPVSCRSRFGIPEDAHVLAFRYKGLYEHFKGGPFLEKCLASLEISRPTYLLMLEHKGGMEHLRKKYEIIELGWVDDQDLLVDALNAADIFLMPSVAEAFGMMAVEAMACGTPVVAFEGTALPEVIHAPLGGIAVPYKDHVALARTIENLLQDRDLYENLVREGLRIVREEYNLDLYVQRHLALYESLVSQS
ncbi:glycosyltransferase [Chloroflexota bacterium]